MGENRIVNHKGTLELKGNRVKLRRYVITDAKNMFYNYANDERVTKFLPWMPYSNIDDVKLFLESQIKEYTKNDVYNWAIEFENEIIGSISATHIDENNQGCEIGYCMGHQYWNQGIMTEAVKLVIDYLFLEVGLHRIMAKHDVENPASGEVMKKCGMTYEGRMKEFYLRHDGTFSDSLVYGIINPNHN